MTTKKRSREAIAVSAEVKTGLDEVNVQLQKHLGSSLSYNEVISYLLVQHGKKGSKNHLDLFDSKHEEPTAELADENRYGEFGEL